MANLMDYIKWRGDLSFQASPFNEIDSLILSLLSYLEFTGIVTGVGEKHKITIRDAAESYLQQFKQEDGSDCTHMQDDVTRMLESLKDTRRFAGCYLSCYVNEISVEEESQFSALKIELEDGSLYLSFSGTDDTLIGWKENFNMSFLDMTPGQKKALKYAGQTIPFYKRKLRFGGHSKGGNLAVFAAMHSRKSVQNRILGVYNHDGPGFAERMISQEGYQRILPRIHTIIPQSSVVGLLLEHEEDVDIIESTNSGLLQHDAFSWSVMGTSFVYLPEISGESVFLDKTLKNWIWSMDEGQRREFVDALFSVLSNAGIQSADQLRKINFKVVLSLLKGTRELNTESRNLLIRMLQRLIEIGRKTAEEQKKLKRL